MTGHCVKKAADGLARYDIALRERAEAHSFCLFCKIFKSLGVRYIVPGNVFLDLILRHSCLVDLHLYGAGGIGHLGDKLVQTFGGEILDDFLAERVIADCADNAA